MFRRIAFGLICFAFGSVLACWSVASIARAWETTTQGLPLLNLIGVALGLAGLGASADLLGRSRPTAAPKDGIAHSVWASIDDLRKYKIGGK